MLDTNTYSDWVKQGTWSRTIQQARRISISTIVLGELYHGFSKGTRASENQSLLDAFLSNPVVSICPVDHEVSKVFGDFVTFLQRKGTPLPTNDIWIASCAYVRGALLLTRDRHFEYLPQVRVKFEE